MKDTIIISLLEQNRNVFKEMLAGIDKDRYLWKQAPEKWCLLEIVCHLYDEEREDFRARVGHVLEARPEPMPSINPQGWVQERQYLQQNYEDKLQAFLEERDRSITWLQSLINPKWDNTYEHPVLGKTTAAMFLANWLAHDYLHIRQITRLKYDYLGRVLTDESLGYAGEW